MSGNKAIFILCALLVAGACGVGHAKQPGGSDFEFEERTSRSLSSLTPEDFGWRWWAASDDEEKEGFLEGIDDCFTFDTKPRRFLFPDYFARIEKYYRNLRADDKYRPEFSVERAAEIFGSSTTSARDGEPAGRRGSLYWVNISRKRKVGFLEGFFSCHFKGKNSQWLRPIVWYVPKLDIVLERNVYSDVDDSSEKDMAVEAGLRRLRSVAPFRQGQEHAKQR